MVKPVTFDVAALSAFFSRSNLFRVVSIGLMACAVGSAVFTTAPKMAGPTGASVNDILNTVIPALAAAASWLISNWTKTSPDLVQAVLALVKSPSDLSAWIRLAAVLAVAYQAARPDSAAAVKLVEFSRMLHDELLGQSSDPATKSVTADSSTI